MFSIMTSQIGSLLEASSNWARYQLVSASFQRYSWICPTFLPGTHSFYCKASLYAKPQPFQQFLPTHGILPPPPTHTHLLGEGVLDVSPRPIGLSLVFLSFFFIYFLQREVRTCFGLEG